MHAQDDSRAGEWADVTLRSAIEPLKAKGLCYDVRETARSLSC